MCPSMQGLGPGSRSSTLGLSTNCRLQFLTCTIEYFLVCPAPLLWGMPCTQCARSAHAVRSFECRPTLKPYFWPF